MALQSGVVNFKVCKVLRDVRLEAALVQKSRIEAEISVNACVLILRVLLNKTRADGQKTQPTRCDVSDNLLGFNARACLQSVKWKMESNVIMDGWMKYSIKNGLLTIVM